MRKIIKERYIFIFMTILIVLYALGVLGIDVIRQNNLKQYIGISNIVFYSLFFVALFFGAYVANKRKTYIENEPFKSYYGATSGIRFVYSLLGIFVIVLYFLLSQELSYPPYFLIAVQLVVISRLFWDKLYITSNKIIIGNSVIEKSKIELAEIENQGLNKRIRFLIEGESYILDFWRVELQDHVINGI